MNKRVSPSQPTFRVLVVTLLLAISALTLTGCDMTPAEVGELLEDVMTLIAPTPSMPTPGSIRPPVAGEGDLWAVYFTNPVIPFDNVTTGGIEENLIWLINEAEQSIDIAMFELDLVNLAEALIAAHERGVQVRVVYDDEYTQDDGVIDLVIEAGIPATPDRRGAYQHNKFVVIDRYIVWTGSMNFTINDVYRNNNNVIVLVSPEVAQNYTVEFEEMFGGAFGPSSPANTPYPGVQVGDLWVETYFSPDDDAMTQLISLVSEAQEYIHFTAFSFTHDGLGDILLAKAAEGVEVVGLFEARGANTAHSECQRLLDAGIDLRLDGNPRVMHNKIMIIDGRVVATGSFNYSENATRSNDENIVFIHSPEVASVYEAEFVRLVSMGVPPAGGQCVVGD
ncbi:MAG: phospholipase D-like domain-containing protein [Aggregatilineales bacterium]|nr:phospholipase D-like domain-containing protein [Aggregatilineales bacterium]HQE18341.1 phospholipase D-like domain-containing protein [Aggregatilineales bacterium]